MKPSVRELILMHTMTLRRGYKSLQRLLSVWHGTEYVDMFCIVTLVLVHVLQFLEATCIHPTLFSFTPTSASSLVYNWSEGPVNDGFDSKERLLNFSFAGPSSELILP